MKAAVIRQSVGQGGFINCRLSLAAHWQLSLKTWGDRCISMSSNICSDLHWLARLSFAALLSSFLVLLLFRRTLEMKNATKFSIDAFHNVIVARQFGLVVVRAHFGTFFDSICHVPKSSIGFLDVSGTTTVATHIYDTVKVGVVHSLTPQSSVLVELGPFDAQTT